MKLSYEEIAEAFVPLTDYVGAITPEAIAALVERDLGAMPRWQPHSPLLHIGSSNASHGVLQSLFRGLVIGARNRVKLPSSGDPVVEDWHASLPGKIRSLTELRHSLSDDWLASASAVVAYGSDASLAAIRNRLRVDQPFIAHGHKISIGVITGFDEETVSAAADDICAFDQLGCLSPIHIYLPSDQIRPFGDQLAEQMTRRQVTHPRAEVSLSTHGAITNLRETASVYAANFPDWHAWQSAESTHWTIIQTPVSHIEPCPLYRTIFLKPLPASGLTAGHLGDDARHLSTIAIAPFCDSLADSLAESLPATRICPMGQAQHPTIDWPADGYSPLGSIVWQQHIG